MKALNCNFQHTTQVSSRRRALFPKDDNNPSSDNSDLDCIKSLSSDSESDSDDFIINQKDRQFHSHIGDYDIIGIVDDDNTIVSKSSCTPQNTKLNTDLSSSSLTTKVDSKELIEDTPSQRFNKTPQDSLNHTQLPKLIRKSTCNSTISDDNKLPLIEKPPIDETENLTKNPKVRTALFRELDMSLSTSSFYPKNNNASPLNHSRFMNKSLSNRKLTTTTTAKHQKTLYLCNRSYRRKIGIINAGVRHGIRKPKKLKRIQDNRAILKAALNIIENSPLNEYLDNNNSNNTELIEDQTIDDQVFIDKEIEDEENQIPEEIDTNRRFFKSSKRKGIVTVSDNIRIEVTNGKMSLIDNTKKTLKRPRLQNNNNNNVVAKRSKPNIDFEIDNNNETLINTNEIDNLIKILDDKENEKNVTNNNNNNNQSVEDVDLIMSPTSQMCNMTSGLALNSPKKAKNLLPVLNNLPSTSTTCNNEQKLYPVFYPRKMQIDKRIESSSPKNNVKKFRQLSKDQMLLDAGQKRFGVTQCTECKFIYHMGDPSDEIIHLNYHEARHIFRFTGWKNERVVSNEMLDGKILQIVPNDPKVWWKKVQDLLEFVNRDLGFYDMTLNNVIKHSQIFLYVKNKTIIGVLVAEVKTEGYRLLTAHLEQIDLCSEESYPIKCGISRIWVAANYRQKGIGTALMDSLKRNFVYGYILKNDDIAFSSPTESGKIFAKSYFKTPNFLIYM